MDQQNENQETPSTVSPNPTDSAPLLARIRSSAAWFYWIAGLSLVNSIVTYFKASVQFTIGLMSSQVLDAIIGSIEAGVLRNVAIGFDALLIFVFALLAYYAGQLKRWAFITGMVLYILDSGLALFFQDYISFGFHVFALVMIFKGFSALNALRKNGAI